MSVVTVLRDVRSAAPVAARAAARATQEPITCDVMPSAPGISPSGITMPRLPPPGGARARGGKWETFLRAVRAAGSGSGVRRGPSTAKRATARGKTKSTEDPGILEIQNQIGSSRVSGIW